MDYDETLLHLDSIVDTHAAVYPVGEESNDKPEHHWSGIWMAGRFKRDNTAEEHAAAARREMLDEISRRHEGRPDFDLREMVRQMEAYEPKSAHFTFEGMDDQFGSFAGFTLKRDTFLESRWLEVWHERDSLWIRVFGGGLVVDAKFPNAQRSA